MTDAKRKNKKFAKMTPSQKRVAIAMDVISTLSSGKIRATHGTYVNMDGPIDFDLGDWGDQFKQPAVRCNVCAKGAIFVAAAMRFDNCPITDESVRCDGRIIFDHDEISETNERYFSTLQLTKIERAFENTLGYYGFGAVFPSGVSPKTRMIRIMENIIKNKGKFVPKQLIAEGKALKSV